MALIVPLVTASITIPESTMWQELGVDMRQPKSKLSEREDVIEV